MVNIRCTKKLLSRLHINKPEDGSTPTNALGDWYANYFNISRKQYIIFTNELTTLSVVIPAKELSTVIQRFAQSLSVLLKSIGISEEKIEFELKEMNNINFTRTKNRSLLGNMNDLTEGAKVWFLTEPNGDLSRLNVRLAGYLVGPSPYHVPREKVHDLFHEKEKVNFIQIDRL